MSTPLKVVGLFAGIGGIEKGFSSSLGSDVETVLLCESWEPAQSVLRDRFPDVDLHPDVRELRRLPQGVDIVAAGFPCTDLSQAGRTAGITGAQSGLVGHVFEMLRSTHAAGRALPWLVIENVPNMLALDRGKAMAYLVAELEHLGYRWAYRVVDSRFTGVPQRRRRVLLVASATEDPRPVLFAEDAGTLDDSHREGAFGFYWTEGKGGLGWARDAVPTLKGGSTIGIPSQPAIWVPESPLERRFVLPGIEEAEALQGFPRGWTETVSGMRRGIGHRWKLVGNAVTTGVAAWLSTQLVAPQPLPDVGLPWTPTGAWPMAAWGEKGKVRRVEISEFPRQAPYQPLRTVVDVQSASPLSQRAIRGFRSRLLQGNLGRYPGFRQDVDSYAALGALFDMKTAAG